MNLVQNQMVELIKSAIKREKYNIDINKQMDWENVIILSRMHKVEALVYSSLSNETKDTIPSEMLNLWKKEVFMSGITQQCHMKEMENVLKEFNKANIDVLLLKGLIIRNLYPEPTLRTMSDADIVVRNSDLEKSKEILSKIGYIEYKKTAKDFMFIKSGCLPIELHWELVDDCYSKKMRKFEGDMWMNIEYVNIGESHAKKMSLEDTIIFQCIHMAKHMTSKGFGIRHLVDFTLLVNKNEIEVDWLNLLERCKKYGIYKFILKVMLASNKLFDMTIPKEINFILIKEDKSYLDEFIRYILESGVHGRENLEAVMTSYLACNENKEDANNDSPLRICINFLFPIVENMSDTYNYAKKYKILYPIAWVHHLLRGVFNKEYSLKDKIKFTTKIASISKNRYDLTDWLEL